MKPIFLNKSNQIINYGQSNRFILTNKKEDIYKKEIEFIKENYTYAKLIILDGNNLTDDIILKNIKELNFNVLYILNKSVDNITDILNNNIQDRESLF